MSLNHGGTETRSKLLHEHLTEQIIGAAIEVHRTLGPGLLESAYEGCLCHEFHLRGIDFRRQVPLPVEYKGVQLDCGYGSISSLKIQSFLSSSALNTSCLFTKHSYSHT
jgi:PD-(D/E)XK nuclease superfamily